MLKVSDVRMKEVINIANGQRMGYIEDFEIDLDNGKIVAMIMSDNGKSLGLFSKPNDIVINWKDIVMIGTDTILIDFDV
ncbi:YlmC/YmxH family sporulation protein [Wansuia hejianensis]|uniref:YlmC/YmxH family sporulation protein n=1 Tax=Wansuia hejianensis TaxID=2763667 RepID=A0A926IMJ9_9FIRM|nr:YlmC/YmxH family sporulation protein [Wansuia hejianensis]MBC8590701.1 YlmC/YmxH family sporulation protein [Wansuia hejianensis]